LVAADANGASGDNALDDAPAVVAAVAAASTVVCEVSSSRDAVAPCESVETARELLVLCVGSAGAADGDAAGDGLSTAAMPRCTLLATARAE
jgi:hypothetical protein